MLDTDASSRVPSKLQKWSHPTTLLNLTIFMGLHPKHVVLKAWLKPDIISPPQRQYIEHLLATYMATQELDICAQFGSSTNTELYSAHAQIIADLRRGFQCISEDGPEINAPSLDVSDCLTEDTFTVVV